MPTDPERAFKRCLELMNEIETEARQRMGGSVFALRTAWRYPRRKIEGHMLATLYDNQLTGYELDKVICDVLDPWCNLRVSGVDLRPIHRPAAFGRPTREQFAGEVDVYGADAIMAPRNEVVDVGAGDEPTDILLHG